MESPFFFPKTIKERCPMEQNIAGKYETLLLEEDQLYVRIETCEQLINTILDLYRSSVTMDYETAQIAISAITNMELAMRAELAAVRTDKAFLARLMKLRKDCDDLKDKIM